MSNFTKVQLNRMKLRSSTIVTNLVHLFLYDKYKINNNYDKLFLNSEEKNFKISMLLMNFRTIQVYGKN